jgi:hypothetical protein
MGPEIKIVNPIQTANQEDYKPPLSLKERQLKHIVPAIYGQNLPQTIARQLFCLSIIIRGALPLSM